MKKNSKPSSASAKDLEFDAEVLFQKIYGKWYAFSVKDEDCLMTEVSEDQVQFYKVRKNQKLAA
jgi:hypothetical protein